MRNYKHYTKVTDYLINCIYLICQKGYVKDVTKNEAFELEEKIDNKYQVIANEVLSFFESADFKNIVFMMNIQTALTQEAICYPNGFIAYAYVVYKKELEKLKELEEKRANQVGFYGEIGKRETFTNLKVECVTSYDACFGYNVVTIYVYKMVNKLGFVFIWKTQKFLLDLNFIKELKGTIKAHSEYKEELQTELTRCKVVAA